MGVVIADRERIIWTAGLGVADVATGRPATPDTLFRVASISKTFVGLAVLKLVEEGRLSLDAPVRGLVPEIAFTNRWEATDPVRVVHLLEHTTGWDEIHPKESEHNDPRPVTLAQGLAVCPESRSSRWRPGTRASYTNSGPSVAAAVVEKVTGKRFEDYVKETFFDPIGLPTADYFYSARSRSLLTNLYRRDGRTPYPYRHTLFRSSGALNASAHEMGAYLRFLLRRGQADSGRILTEASMRRMETPVSSYGAQGGLEVGCGLNNCPSIDHRGFLWHGHMGAIDGALSTLSYRHQEGVGYFFALNASSWKAFGEVDRELAAYLTKDLADPVAPTTSTVATTLRDTYDGWYLPANPRVQALAWQGRLLGLRRLTVQDRGLTIASLLGPPRRFAAVDATRFRPEKTSVPTVALMDTPDGRLHVWFESVYLRISAVQAWAQIALTGLVLFALLSVPLFALVWGARWIFRRPRGVPALHLRVLPLLAWSSGLGAALLVPDLVIAHDNSAASFGRPTVWSVGLTLAILAFAVFSCASLLAALRAWRRRKTMNALAYYHSLAVAVAFVVATLYLGWYGVIGYRSWA
jgi:CubicO group peptidase (beta-lactamase class C family)